MPDSDGRLCPWKTWLQQGTYMFVTFRTQNVLKTYTLIISVALNILTFISRHFETWQSPWQNHSGPMGLTGLGRGDAFQGFTVWGLGVWGFRV